MLKFSLCFKHLVICKWIRSAMTVSQSLCSDLRYFSIPAVWISQFKFFQITMRTLFLQLLVIYSTQALEQPIRASFLQPRNFNPHPYQIEPRNFLIHAEEPQAYAPQKSYEQLSRQFQKYLIYFIISKFLTFIFFQQSTGPIQFPPNLEDAAQPTQQQLDQQRRVTSHIVDQQALIPRPYEKLAKQYRAQQLHRYKGVVSYSNASFFFF